MGRRLLVGVCMLILAVFGAGSARAQAQAEGEQDDGWFEAPGEASQNSEAPPAEAVPGESQLVGDPARVPSPAPDDADPRALTDFRPALDPYGSWVEDPTYGTVWMPHAAVVGDSFSPYVSGGHWALSTNDDWVWVSDYPFGWVVFHYGRWVWISGQGWAWIPGYEYAPAWVNWRVPTGEYAYVGWAPSPPNYIWVSGFAVGFYYSSPYYWVFCPSPYVFHTHVYDYMVRDHVMLGRLGASSRYYVPAQPSPRPRPPGAHGAPRTPAAPSIAAARVPATAVPRERVLIAPAQRPVPPSTRQRFVEGARPISPTALRPSVPAMVRPSAPAAVRPSTPAMVRPSAPSVVTPGRSTLPAPSKRTTVNPVRLKPKRSVVVDSPRLSPGRVKMNRAPAFRRGARP